MIGNIAYIFLVLHTLKERCRRSDLLWEQKPVVSQDTETFPPTMLMINKEAQHKPRKSQSAYTIPLYLFCDFFMKPIDSTDNFVYNVLVQ